MKLLYSSRRIIAGLILLSGLGWSIKWVSVESPIAWRITSRILFLSGTGAWGLFKIEDPQFLEIWGCLAFVGVLGLVGFFWGPGILDWLCNSQLKPVLKKKVVKNGVARFLTRLRERMHSGLLKKAPWVTLFLNMLPIPVPYFGDVLTIAARSFVGLGNLKYRTAVIWLLVNCVIRSYLWCAIVYHRFG